jgi:hypothetical protein
MSNELDRVWEMAVLPCFEGSHKIFGSTEENHEIVDHY